jgi:hypothetical protein
MSGIVLSRSRQWRPPPMTVSSAPFWTGGGRAGFFPASAGTIVKTLEFRPGGGFFQARLDGTQHLHRQPHARARPRAGRDRRAEMILSVPKLEALAASEPPRSPAPTQTRLCVGRDEG